jgi:hypothetical protein
MVPENKAVSGFHLLMILSYVDGYFAAEESQVAAKYISKHFTEEFRIEKETRFLKTLKEEEYFFHFTECMDHFYSRSSAAERTDLIRFAMEMIRADLKITPEENRYFLEILNSWEPEHAG